MAILFTGGDRAQRAVVIISGVLACAVAFMLVGGCATTENQGNSIPLDRQYQPPQHTEANATLLGIDSPTFFTGYTVFVSSIDGKCVMAGRAGWKDALPISPGQHKIIVQFASGAHEARVKLTLQAQSGHSYRTGYLDGGGTIVGPGLYLDLWLDDVKTGERATPAIRSGIGINTEGPQLCAELFRVVE